MTCRSKTSQSVLLNWLKVGAAVSNNLVTHLVPVSTANKVPALRPNRYAWLNTVAEIIARWRTSEWAEARSGFLVLNFFGS